MVWPIQIPLSTLDEWFHSFAVGNTTDLCASNLWHYVYAKPANEHLDSDNNLC